LAPLFPGPFPSVSKVAKCPMFSATPIAPRAGIRRDQTGTGQGSNMKTQRKPGESVETQ
jgi:hypothetical protein